MTAILMFLLALMASPAWAAYDGHWHSADFWSGAFPNGFAVVEKGITVKARATMDPAVPADTSCALPYGAVYHPWNSQRHATFVSESKIVPMVTKEALTIGEGGDMATLRKGEKLDYLVYESNGLFAVRYHDKEYQADQSILDKVIYDRVALDQPQDEWIKVRCQNHHSAWIFLRDLQRMDENGNEVYHSGIASPSRGLRAEGAEGEPVVHDLPKKQL